MGVDATQVTALILAGGRGRRMGGEDKGLLPLAQKPLVQHVIEAVAGRASGVLISANRNLEQYRAFGWPVLADPLEDHQGPLAGILAGMRAADTPWLVTLPCDAPQLGHGFIPRLLARQQETNAEIVTAHDGCRLQPVHALLQTSLVRSLEGFLAAGERKVDLWYARHQWTTADFSDVPHWFANLNTPEDRARLLHPD
ncbi:molybdenum cofactor guanylyltransferase [Thiohalocapsa marina]|uniref:Molybdenum cofactor guanylyltransferase n=1 Tax=Thiohalocapsa marina TaxID=424902 RepID=A0A5M8FVS9_9GAMM|nr:molybdenum cofactor guanylyltransferase MobA [Thiohalocapsa marina]KAA6187809.1 molybdenum cofactor guanylyltransferase [Thiohalocapsa marina]